MKPRSEQIQLTQEIVDAIRAGERTAFDTLFRRIGGRVYVYIAARMGGPLRRVMEPEDLLQEVYLEAFEHFDAFENKGPGSLVRWMIGIAANRMRQAYERHYEAKRRDVRREVPLQDESEGRPVEISTPDPTPSRIVARNENVHRLARALGSLEEGDREVILLRVFEGLSLADVAARTGHPRTTVAYRLTRALSRLEGELPDLNTIW